MMRYLILLILLLAAGCASVPVATMPLPPKPALGPVPFKTVAEMPEMSIDVYPCSDAITAVIGDFDYEGSEYRIVVALHDEKLGDFLLIGFAEETVWRGSLAAEQ